MGVLGLEVSAKSFYKERSGSVFLSVSFGDPLFFISKFRGFWFFDSDLAIDWAWRGHRALPSKNQPLSPSTAIELI